MIRLLVLFLFLSGAARAQPAPEGMSGGFGVPSCGKMSWATGKPLPTTVDATGSGCIAPPATTPTTQSPGTVTTGGTFQTALPANPSRTSCLIQNTSAHTAYVYWLATGTASLTNALQISAGASFFCVGPSGAPIRTAIQWMTSTTGDTFVVTENQ